MKTTFNHNFAYNKEHPSLALARFHLYQTKRIRNLQNQPQKVLIYKLQSTIILILGLLSTTQPKPPYLQSTSFQESFHYLPTLISKIDNLQ